MVERRAVRVGLRALAAVAVWIGASQATAADAASAQLLSVLAEAAPPAQCRVCANAEVGCTPCCRPLEPLVGWRVDDAVERLKRTGFGDPLQIVRPSGLARGFVAGTNPHAGGAVCPGQRVTLYVSGGTAPPLEGLPLHVARAVARDAGVVLDEPEQRCGTDEHDLAIERQWPLAGEPLIDRRRAVEVVLRPRYPLPPLEGLGVSAAHRSLCGFGWRGHTVRIGTLEVAACGDDATGISGDVTAAFASPAVYTATTTRDDCRIDLAVLRKETIEIPVPGIVTETSIAISAEAAIGATIALLTLLWVWPQLDRDETARRGGTRRSR
jgi:hypothetical protein